MVQELLIIQARGVDGKLRLFITKENSNYFPNLLKLITELQSKVIHEKISNLLKKDLSYSFVRLEVIGDQKRLLA